MGNKLLRNGVFGLKNSQKGEVWAMKQMGAGRDDIRSTKLANRDELAAFKGAFANSGQEGFVAPSTTTAINAQGDMGANVGALFKQAGDTRTQYNLPGLSGNPEKVSHGFGDAHLVKTLYNQQNNVPLNKNLRGYGQMLDRAQTQWGQNLTADQIARNGNLRTIKQLRGGDGLYAVNRNYGVGNNDKMRISDTYKMNPDGTYTLTGFNRTHQEIQSKPGFGLGQALSLAGLAAFGIPALGVGGLATASIPTALNTAGGLASTAAGQIK